MEESGLFDMKQKKGRMKEMLTEALSMLCRNCFSFKEELTIEGLIGITVDQEHVLVVSMNETLQGKEAAACSDGSHSDKAMSPKEADEEEEEGADKCKSVESSVDSPCSHMKDSESLKQVPRRKQRKPIQIKEEVSEKVNVEEEEDEEDVEWSSPFPSVPPPPPFTPLLPFPMALPTVHPNLQPEQSVENRLKSDMDPSPSSSGSCRSVSSSISADLAQRMDAPILSIPSPQNFVKPPMKMRDSSLMYSDEECLWLGPVFTGGTMSSVPLDLTNKEENVKCPKKYRVKDLQHSAVRCPVCRKSFDSRIKYNRHKRSHRGIFTCKVCGRAYNRKDNMQRHYKLYHSAYLEAQGMSLEDGFTVSQQQSPIMHEDDLADKSP